MFEPQIVSFVCVCVCVRVFLPMCACVHVLSAQMGVHVCIHGCIWEYISMCVYVSALEMSVYSFSAVFLSCILLSLYLDYRRLTCGWTISPPFCLRRRMLNY